METEVKTLIYRNRAEDGKAKHRPFATGKKKVIAPLSAAVLVIAIVAVLVGGVGKVGAEGKDGATNSTGINEMQESTASAGDIYGSFDAVQTGSITGQKVSESCSAVQTGSVTGQKVSESSSAVQTGCVTAQKVSESCSAAQNGMGLLPGAAVSDNGLSELEENIVLMLLAETDYDEEDIYFPATLGLDNVLMLPGTSVSEAAEDESADAEEDAENADDASDIPSRLDEVEELTSHVKAPADKPEGLVFKYNTKMMLDLSAEEIEVLERIVEAEATGQSVYGKMLVANVVINRVNSRYFANNVKDVVFQTIGGSVQFSPIKDGRYYSVEITDGTREAIERVLAGEDYSQGALYFFQRTKTSKTKATWFDRNLKFLFKYGCHEFFTEFKK